MTHGNRRTTKALSAFVGGGALVIMGLLTATFDKAPADSGPVSYAGGMTTGATVTETTPAASLETSVAVPAVKAVAYK